MNRRQSSNVRTNLNHPHTTLLLFIDCIKCNLNTMTPRWKDITNRTIFHSTSISTLRIKTTQNAMNWMALKLNHFPSVILAIATRQVHLFECDIFLAADSRQFLFKKGCTAWTASERRDPRQQKNHPLFTKVIKLYYIAHTRHPNQIPPPSPASPKSSHRDCSKNRWRLSRAQNPFQQKKLLNKTVSYIWMRRCLSATITTYHSVGQGLMLLPCRWVFFACSNVQCLGKEYFEWQTRIRTAQAVSDEPNITCFLYRILYSGVNK